jgi:hypothetical protein
MKKLLLIMLLTFTTFSIADEGRYTMVNKPEGSYGVWILDSERGELKYCSYPRYEIVCSKWKDLKHDEE